MKVVVLGKNGMLGSMVFEYLKKERYDVFGTDRTSLDAIEFVNETGKNVSALPQIKAADYVINCIGVIKPQINEEDPRSVQNALLVNSLFPRVMSNYCAEHNTKFIHITTDCVFSGEDMETLKENSPHTANDVYGKSKSLGEPEKCMTLRTSIIGPEPNNKRSLLEWVLSKKNGSIYGFSTHVWNGVTTLQLAKNLQKIMEKNLYRREIYHIFSEFGFSKLTLIRLINEIFELNLNIVEDRPTFCDRSISTVKSLNSILNQPNFKDQLKELKEWMG